MSLLKQLRDRKRTLRQTDTVVTRADGSRFLESDRDRADGTQTQAIPPRPYGFVVDTKPDNQPAKVTGHVYLGSQDCCEPAILEAHRICHVLSVGIQAGSVSSTDRDSSATVAHTFVECLDLPETDIAPVVRRCTDVIDACVRAGRNVLVHCNAGVSRSPSVVIAYLMQRRNCQYQDAYDLVKAVRPCIRPNAGFEAQLRRLQIDHSI